MRSISYYLRFLCLLTAMTCLLVCCKSTRDRISDVQRLNNQDELTKIAIGDENIFVRRAAVDMLTNESVLLKIALEDTSQWVQLGAIGHITDQVALSQIVHAAHNLEARFAAVKKIVDNKVLTELLEHERNTDIRIYCVTHISDQNIISRTVLMDTDVQVRMAAYRSFKDHFIEVDIINKLRDSDSILVQIAGDDSHNPFDAPEALAAIKLITQDPLIQERYPNMYCDARIRKISRIYIGESSSEKITCYGENVDIKLRQKGKTLCEYEWETNFPNMSFGIPWEQASVDPADLLSKLFRLKAFKSEDIAKLIHSKNPEIRVGAIYNSSDKSILEKFAKKDTNDRVQGAAINRLRLL